MNKCLAGTPYSKTCAADVAEVDFSVRNSGLEENEAAKMSGTFLASQSKQSFRHCRICKP